MLRTCNQLPANAKQAIPHLGSVIPARALPSSGRCQVAFPGQAAHLGGRRALRAAPKLRRPLQAILDIDRKLRFSHFSCIGRIRPNPLEWSGDSAQISARYERKQGLFPPLAYSFNMQSKLKVPNSNSTIY